MSRILVVDDEANLRKVLAAILRKDGYEVAVAVVGEVVGERACRSGGFVREVVRHVADCTGRRRG